MFKNLTIYRVTSGMPDGHTLQTRMESDEFHPTTMYDEKRVGWVPPRGFEDGSLLESVNGQWVLRFMAETRQVPASVVQAWVQAACAQIEATTGRKPGKKERRDLKVDAMAALLPRAFPRQLATWVWLDPVAGRLVLDTASKAVADDIVTALVRALDGFSVAPLNTATSPAVAMAAWLVEQDAPGAFGIGKACELRSCDESQAKVRYSHHQLLIEEVQAHIAHGKRPTSLALDWGGRVDFVLTDAGHIKHVAFADDVLQAAKDQGQAADDFDGNVVMATGELAPLIADLVDALGGEA